MKKNPRSKLPLDTPLTDAERELLQRLTPHLTGLGYDPNDPNLILDFPRKHIITSVRLTSGAKFLLKKLIEHHGMSQTTIIELAIRQKAQRDGLMEIPNGSPTETPQKRRALGSR